MKNLLFHIELTGDVRMKKGLLALIATALILTQSLAARADQLQDITQRGVIRVAVPQDFPPFGSVALTCSRRGTILIWPVTWQNR